MSVASRLVVPRLIRLPVTRRISTAWNRQQVWNFLWSCGLALLLLLAAQPARAHIVAPEQFHPVVESYRRVMFLANLNPVLWDEVQADTSRIATGLEAISKERADTYRRAVADIIAKPTAPAKEGEDPPGPDVRKHAARIVFELSTCAVTDLLTAKLEEFKMEAATGHRAEAARCLDLARQYWASFEYEVRFTDPPMFREIGLIWLKMATALGNAPFLGQGETPMDAKTIQRESDEILAYVKTCYADFHAQENRALAPVPVASKTYDASATIPPKLPPGSNINKQRPRPRQILNLVARGADETDTPLVAFGDMAFDSSLIFGEPARSLGVSCNSCHNKSITNPQLFIPGLTKYPGGADVSSSFFAPHANNGHFDPLDIPDLRGIRFTAPYGRNGRFGSLRDFVRNVIVNEFNGLEPDPIVLDAILAYMTEFDFLPNRMLNKDGMLNGKAPKAALRGEQLFNKPFAKMNGMSCASCHVPSSNFVDGRRHAIGSVKGTEDDSIDRAMDTPTLLSSRFTAPYFHDGSLGTLKDVALWFNENYHLRLDPNQVSDLTAYLEAVGDGQEPYEESPDLSAPGEVEEQYIFMASWEFMRDKGKFDLASLLFRTVAQELRNEKWELKYPEATGVVEKMAQLADACVAANQGGRIETVNTQVTAFRKLFEENADLIAGKATPERKAAQAVPAAGSAAQTAPSTDRRPVNYPVGRK